MFSISFSLKWNSLIFPWLLLVNHSVVCNSLWHHGLQHTRLPCPSLSLGVCTDSCPLSWWCRPTICPLLPPSLPALSISQHEDLFQWVKSLQQVAEVFEPQLQHQSFQWMFSVDFLRIEWFDLLAVQGTLNSLLQHHSSNASILHCSTFFMVQLPNYTYV